MGLDIYVGSLTRYYAGDWQTVVQQAGQEMGMAVEIIRPHQTEGAIKDQNEIGQIVVAWRDQLSQALGANLAAPLTWNESHEVPYFTDKPAWDCYTSLLLWAAYDEHREMNRPAEYVEDLATDPAFLASTEDGFRSRYGQLLHDVEIWFPCDFEFTFRSPDPSGNQLTMGSSVTLAKQLKDLNDRTWRADGETLKAWRTEGAESQCPLEIGARFAFAIVVELAEQSVTHKLPMRLDY